MMLRGDSKRLATIHFLLREPPGHGANRRVGNLAVAIVGDADSRRWPRAIAGDVIGIAWVTAPEAGAAVVAARAESYVIDAHIELA